MVKKACFLPKTFLPDGMGKKKVQRAHLQVIARRLRPVARPTRPGWPRIKHTHTHRVAGCALGWHARHLHLPKASASGNANGGKRPFPLAKSKGNGLSNGRSNDPRSNVINLERRLNLAALKQLRTELALEKAKRSTPVTTTVGTRTFAEVAAPVHAHFQPTQPKKVSDRYDVHVAFEEMGRRFMEQLAALAASIPRM